MATDSCILKVDTGEIYNYAPYDRKIHSTLERKFSAICSSLYIASFFFWASGTLLPKSQAILLQSEDTWLLSGSKASSKHWSTRARYRSADNVKLCVSSRPHWVFQDAFTTRLSLRVQYTSASDIKYFVRDELGDDASPLARLRILPRDLKEHSHIILKVDETYRAEASRLVKLIHEAATYRPVADLLLTVPPLTILAASFAEDADFDLICSKPTELLTWEKLSTRCENGFSDRKPVWRQVSLI
ncbi:hypothetical protein HYFRA_00004000 [Hymenoscyphus fraxineus]|uniref:Uncharacterized protein n=1 Tax=Hymenoscyphus fraxineus TaxID=746836 RepID=A0A9N9KPE6_9HELO|nr:hypothetical protein HYFRA_00004000 [Hymenoscyphus fraxineus]